MTDKEMRRMMRAAVEAAAEKAAQKVASAAIAAQQSATITALARELRVAGWQERDAAVRADGEVRERLAKSLATVEELSKRVDELEDVVREANEQVDRAVEAAVQGVLEEQQRRDEAEVIEALARAADEGVPFRCDYRSAMNLAQEILDTDEVTEAMTMAIGAVRNIAAAYTRLYSGEYRDDPDYEPPHDSDVPF